ncbi:MAG: hypothetical protein KTR30_24135 [Saprospiraceae bacterium]|nr:hypothetical protein [Saprospiraceae bacterium]
MVTSITVLLVLVPVILLLGRGSQLFRQTEVKAGLEDLLHSTEDTPTPIYTSESLKDLPLPVQRYFKYAMAEGQAYIRQVKLKHKGWFRQSLKHRWKPIRGEEYFTCFPPGFLWRGKLSWFSAVDKYIRGKGNLKVKLLSILPIVNAKGKATDQGEFLRWLAEAVWFPTALLPSERLSWTPVDEQSAKIHYADKHIQVEGVFHFNEMGQITHFKAKRHMDDERLEKWTTHCKDYRLVQALQVPFYAEAVWNLPDGDFCYAKFEVEEIDYQSA